MVRLHFLLHKISNTMGFCVAYKYERVDIMPNWCINKYSFYTDKEDKGELLQLYKNLEAVMNIPSDVSNGFGLGWLGEVAIKHGLDWEKISCRGEMTNLGDYEPGDWYFMLDADTAWSPTDELWETVIEQYEDVYYVYVAEEPGCEIFINTDTEGRFFNETYLIDIGGDIPIPAGWFADQEKPKHLEIREYFASFAELNDYCSQFTGKDFDSFEEWQDYFAEIFDNEDNAYASINEFAAA